MPRYVILRHELPSESSRGSHWDVMFEAEAALRTWAVTAPPDGVAPQPAEPLADHRREYLTYEGPVSGNRGTVQRWDEGTFNTLSDDATALVVDVVGRVLDGTITLRRDPSVYQYAPRGTCATSP